MKKVFKSSVAIMLVLGLGLVGMGCSSKDNSSQSNQSTAKSNSQNENDNKQASSNKQQEDQWFMGEWIAKEVVAYSKEGAKNNECEEHIGEKVSYSADKVTNYEGPKNHESEEVCNNPKYELTKITDKEFGDKWKTDLNSLGINAKEAEVMTVKEKDNESWNEFGDYIIKKDNNHIILSYDGGFFLMEKVTSNN